MAPISAWSSRTVVPCFCVQISLLIRRHQSLDQGGLITSNPVCKDPTSKYRPFPRFQVDVNLEGTIQPSTVGALARYLPLFIKLLSISSGISVLPYLKVQACYQPSTKMV